MKKSCEIVIVVLLVALTILVACKPQTVIQTVIKTNIRTVVQTVVQTVADNYAQAAPQPTPASLKPASGQASGAGQTNQPSQGGNSSAMDVAAASVNPNSRMIIKDAQITLLVEDSDVAIDRTTQVVSDVGGYVISSRVWFQSWLNKDYKYSTITIGVPVDQFERALSRLRALAIRVEDETASGEDVTDQYVDLESQLRNLEATRDRLRTFLDRAQTVQEALSVNTELSKIEDQIEEIQGQMNYLAGRAAYSTITVTIDPQLPEIPTPTPFSTFTPSPTFTAAPTITPTPWKPGEVFQESSKTVVNIYKELIDNIIWFLVVVVPIIAPPFLIGWGIWWLVKRKRKKPVSEGEKKAG